MPFRNVWRNRVQASVTTWRTLNLLGFSSGYGLRRSMHRGRGDLLLHVPVLIEPVQREIELVAFLLGEFRFHLGDRFRKHGAVELFQRLRDVGENGEALFRHFGKAAE